MSDAGTTEPAPVNSNNVLRTAPWVVVADDGVATGVADRFAAEADAKADADARAKALEEAGNTTTTFSVVKEDDPEAGLHVEPAKAKSAKASRSGSSTPAA